MMHSVYTEVQQYISGTTLEWKANRNHTSSRRICMQDCVQCSSLREVGTETWHFHSLICRQSRCNDTDQSTFYHHSITATLSVICSNSAMHNGSLIYTRSSYYCMHILVYFHFPQYLIKSYWMQHSHQAKAKDFVIKAKAKAKATALCPRDISRTRPSP